MPIMKLMVNNTSNKNHCITCGTTHGILNCDECQLTFCERHIIKHRQELTYQLKDIVHDHDLLQEEIGQSFNEYFYVRKIDKWEEESIKKIRITAENARVNVRHILEKSKRRLTRISHTIGFDLKSSYRTGDFLENDLTRWIKQINELRLEIQSSYSLELIEDQQSPIYLIKVTQNKLPNTRRHINNSSYSNLEERFSKAIYPASIENGGFIGKHIGSNLDYGYLIGKQLYSQGNYTTRLKIVQSSHPYIIFFGCISSEGVSKAINYKSPFVVGWFGHNEIYQHGIWNNNVHIYGYDSNEIQTNDILCLTFDCNRRQIGLFHERLNKTYKLSVNIDKAPLPWQLLVVLVNENDCVKILPKK